MEKIISFIVPSYNCEKFLDKCLTSFINQEVMDKIEVITVNDGSEDSTLSVAEKYCQMYPDSFRVISQENKGHGGALNTGCSAAQGKFLKAVDADDWVETENLPGLIEQLENCRADVALAHHYTRDQLTGEVKKWRSFPEEFGVSYTMEQVMSSWKSFDRSLTFHGIIYRTDFYKAHCMQLPEHVFYEDHLYATVPCCYAQSVFPIDIFLYNYRIGDSSQSVSDINQLRRISHTAKVLDCFIRQMDKLSLDEDSAGMRFYCMKAQGLLLSFVTTALLVEKDRTKGRRMGDLMMEKFRRSMPETYRLAVRQYSVFRSMNLLGLSKNAWTAVKDSELYNKLRNNHDFN